MILTSIMSAVFFTLLLLTGHTIAQSMQERIPETGGQIMFAFDVSPQLLGNGLLAALAIGFVGGLLPAIRAARIPIATALREL